MHARRSAILAISFLTCVSVAGIVNAAPAAQCKAPAAASDVSVQQALRGATPAGDRDSDAHPGERQALDEMLRGSQETPLRWDRAPELVVLMPIMQYEKGRGTEYRATSEQLSDQEAIQLIADLTDALAALTDNTFQRFSSVRRESVAAGEVVNVMRPGQIVVARYSGVRDQQATIGFGGRSTRGSTIRAGSIILDNDFDRSNETRQLLRMHELGHALGYNHVLSRPSIMNPKIGPQPTDLDRAAIRIAFRDFQPAASSCST